MQESDLDDVLQNRSLPPPWDRIFSLGSRIFVWGLLFGIIYILRPFFLLVFLTFVFAYILEHGVQGLEHRIRSRAGRVVLVASVFLSTLILIGVFLAPHFAAQASKLAQNYPEYERALDDLIEGARNSKFLLFNKIGDDVTAAGLIEQALGFVDDPNANLVVPDPGDGEAPHDVAPKSEAASKNVERAIDLLRGVAGSILALGSAFLLSLIFSFLIVLDLPKLRSGVTGLAHTKLRFIYIEAADNIRDFGIMVGRALEAQLFIAMCNTVLTALGLYLLGLENNLIFFSTVVFFCSFIPVAGVFISSTPIAIEALTTSGVNLMLLAIVMILIVHFVEAYFLNPRIFGHHLRMNPVLVLIVLTVAGKLFGIWGLVLGLPVVNYFFTHAIRRRADATDAGPTPAAGS